MHSDQFQVSLNELIFSYNPNSIDQIKKILDENGYYGRHQVYTVNVNKSTDVCIKIRIYLVDSCYYYTWPFLTHYNLTRKCFGKRKIPALIKNDFKISKCMYFFTTFRYIITGKIDPIAEIAHLYMGWATKNEYIKIITYLSTNGFFKDGDFCLKSAIDVHEVHKNLFDANYLTM